MPCGIGDAPLARRCPAALATLRFPPMHCGIDDAALSADALRH
jgi:hypothetical protein